MTTQPIDVRRPHRAVFADRSKAEPMALHPSAIGVSYPTHVDEETIEIVSGVAVICVDGPLLHKPDPSGWMCWENYEALACRFVTAIASPDVGAVLLKFDSPGGDVAGLFETVRLMQAAKAKAGKPVYAYIDEDCYSAAYALAMVADEIYVPPSGNVGSIGVITVMGEMTEADKKAGVRVEVITSGAQKADGHPHAELTDDAIARTQTRVDALAQMFFALVSEARAIPIATIEAMQAGVRTGVEAVTSGLADGVLSLSDLLTTAAAMVVSAEIATGQSVDKETPPMAGLLAATKALNDANAALAAAKTDDERKAAASAVTQAEVKYKHVKKTIETIESEDEPEPSDEDEDASKADGEDDEKDAKAETARPKTAAGVLSLAREITGKQSIDEVMGALHAMDQANRRFGKMAKRVEALESEARRKEVSALVRDGMAARKISPAQKAWALAQTAAVLKAYIDATPPLVHAIDEAHVEEKTTAQPFGAVTPDMARIWAKQGYSAKDFPALLAKLNETNGAGDGANGAVR